MSNNDAYIADQYRKEGKEIMFHGCPFCGSPDRDKHVLLGKHKDNGEWRAICSACGATGPFSDTPTGAQDVWNSRATKMMGFISTPKGH